jgi:uncharacterized small protein (DUF1192 family)
MDPVSTAGQAVQRCQAPVEWRKIMVIEDDAPPPKPVRLQKLALDLLGVEELGEYIGELRAEIARVEADVARKRQHRSAADAFFRKP